MNLLRRLSILCGAVMFAVTVVLCFILSRLREPNVLAISATLLAGFGTLYILLFGMIRRTSRLIEVGREELRVFQKKVQSQRIELLKRIGASALGESGIDALLDEAVQDVRGMLELPRCAIRLFGNPDKLVENCSPGFPSSEPFFPWPLRPSDSRETYEKGRALVIDDLRRSSRYLEWKEAAERVRLGSYVGVPLRVHDALIGVLFLDRAEPHAWTEDEVGTAEAVGRQISVAIRHTRLFESQQELSSRLMSLMDNVPGVVYRGLRDWSLPLIGADVVRLTGYPAKDFMSRMVGWRDIVHPDDIEPLKERFREAVRKEEKVLRVEYRIRHRDGSIRWLADRRQLFFDPQGGFSYVDGLLLDITNRKKSEEELRLMQFAVDRAGDAAYWMVPDGRLIYVNDQACKGLGYTCEELLSMTIHQINPEFPAEKWAAHWEDLRKRQSYTMESRHRAKDGRIIPVEVTVNYLEFDGKEYNCVSARDITKRVEAQERSRFLEAELLQAQKMEAIGSLAGGIAHDFNNLLTGILGYANLLKIKAKPGSEVLKAANVIQDAADRASQLTAQLLGFARRGKNLAVPVDIHRVIDDVSGLIERAMDKRIRIRKFFAPDAVTVVGDPTQLQQMLMNMAVNARDAMPEGGVLTFSTSVVRRDEIRSGSRSDLESGSYARIDLADTGTGIPESHLEKIFDPFFTTKEQGKGTGLGLAMVFGIVKNHGGYIEVESKVGAGSLFKIYLPLADGKGREEEIVSSRSAETEEGRGSVLLIDDQETVREVCSAMLQTLGYRVSTASDGREGVEYYRRFGGNIDLVIIDMIMPNLGGRDCFREIKAMNPEVRAILSTGFSLDGAVQEIIDEGISGFIQKPYRLEQLSRAVSKAMGRDN
ncbi:MAG: PAS domain S-box protein [Deltaproteobacteria bacterium]|nr:PAS domain S-box protein [Deltaproteobacteria bacterium]